MATRKYTLKVDVFVSADIDFTDPFQRMEVFRALQEELKGRLPAELRGETVGAITATYGPITAVA